MMALQDFMVMDLRELLQDVETSRGDGRLLALPRKLTLRAYASAFSSRNPAAVCSTTTTSSVVRANRRHLGNCIN